MPSKIERIGFLFVVTLFLGVLFSSIYTLFFANYSSEDDISSEDAIHNNENVPSSSGTFSPKIKKGLITSPNKLFGDRYKQRKKERKENFIKYLKNKIEIGDVDYQAVKKDITFLDDMVILNKSEIFSADIPPDKILIEKNNFYLVNKDHYHGAIPRRTAYFDHHSNRVKITNNFLSFTMKSNTDLRDIHNNFQSHKIEVYKNYVKIQFKNIDDYYKIKDIVIKNNFSTDIRPNSTPGIFKAL